MGEGPRTPLPAQEGQCWTQGIGKVCDVGIVGLVVLHSSSNTQYKLNKLGRTQGRVCADLGYCLAQLLLRLEGAYSTESATLTLTDGHTHTHTRADR